MQIQYCAAVEMNTSRSKTTRRKKKQEINATEQKAYVSDTLYRPKKCWLMSGTMEKLYKGVKRKKKKERKKGGEL